MAARRDVPSREGISLERRPLRLLQEQRLTAIQKLRTAEEG